MNPATAYAIGFSFLMLLTAAVLLFVRRPLFAILDELCAAEYRARFWLRLYGASLFITVFFFSLWSPPRSTGGKEIDFLDFIGMLRLGSFGLLGSLAALALIMIPFIRQRERDERLSMRTTPSE